MLDLTDLRWAVVHRHTGVVIAAFKWRYDAGAFLAKVDKNKFDLIELSKAQIRPLGANPFDEPFA